MEKLDIFQYTSYRSYITSSFEETKRRNPMWSYSSFANKLGLKSSTSILKVVKGQREAGPEITNKLISYFKFNKSEREYFQSLIQLSKVGARPNQSKQLFDHLQKRAHGRRILAESEFSVISDWYCYALRQYCRLKPRLNDPKEISKHFLFSVTPTKIERAISDLVRLGLLKLNAETNELTCTSERLDTRPEVASEAVRCFHESMLENARNAVRKIPVEERSFSGYTMTIDKKNLKAAKQFMDDMLDEFSRKFCTPDGQGDSVYQYQAQLFPLLKEHQRDSNE